MLKLAKQKFSLILSIGVILPMLFSGFLTIAQPQQAFAIDLPTAQKCFDKFDEPDIIYSRLSSADQQLFNTCLSAGACTYVYTGTIIDSKQYKCTDPTPVKDATKATATDAEVKPLQTLICGTTPTGESALAAYSSCAAKVRTVYTRCATTGGSAVNAMQETTDKTATCVKSAYSSVAKIDIVKAIDAGRAASTTVNEQAIAKENEKACVADGNDDGQPDGSWESTADGGTCTPVENTAADDCPLGPEAPMKWLGCAIMKTAGLATEKMYTLIQNFLYTPTSMIFDNASLKSASDSLRNLAIGLILIAGLFMVIAQATGSDLVDAYTIRKLLPRIGVAIIGIALAWPLLEFAVTFINTIGLLADRILSGVVMSGGETTDTGIGTNILSFIFGAGGVGLAFKLMSTSLIPLAGTILLGMLVGLLVLAIRQLVLMVCIMLAPLAIAAYVLPGTQKMWNLWKNTLMTTLLMFPIIMFFLASGEAFAYVLGGSDSGTMTVLAVIVFIAPYFLLPFAFKLAGGLMSTIFSIANDKGKGGFDKLRKSRQQMGAQHRERTIGRRVLQKRADYAGRLQSSASRAGRSGIGRRALNAAAHGVGGYNIEADMSAKRDAVTKEVKGQIATGADGEVRGLSVNKQQALRGREDEDWRVKDGQREFRTLGGAWVSESEVDRGHARWGKDTFAQQAALSYEMSKANSEEDVRRISKGYKSIAQGPGGWGMSKYEAGGAWIGAAFENQNQHLEFKKTKWDQDGKVDFDGLASEAYEKKGSYQTGQMHSSTIEQLKEGYADADMQIATGNAVIADTTSSQTDKDAAAQSVAKAMLRKQKIEGVAETFMHDMRGGIPGGVIPGEEGKAAQTIPTEQGVPGAEGRLVSAQGAAHTNERIYELAKMTGVLNKKPTSAYGPFHDAAPNFNPTTGVRTEVGTQRQS
ncbi:MAG: hypothetical protein WAS36_05350 [Candidatus Saccharimonadales bacterium]